MGFLSDLFGEVPIVGDLIEGAQSHHNMRDQMEHQIRMRGTAYQATVKDLQKAGLNPMLAYGQGPTQATQGSAPSAPKYGSTMVSSAAQQVQKESIAVQNDLTKAQANQVRSQTVEQSVNAAIKAVELKNMQMLSEKILAEIGLSQAQGMKTRQDVDTGKFLQALKKLELERDTSTFSADVAKRKAESLTAQYGTSEAKAKSDFWKTDFGGATPALRELMPILRGISIMFGGR